MDFEKILKVAVRGGASDILLKTGAMPRFRFNGELVTLSDGQLITAAIMQAWISLIMPKYLLERLQAAGDVDFAFQSSAGHRFRVNLFRQRQVYGMVLRIISNHIRTLEELQLPPVLSQLTEERRGLVLVTGSTGNGKSTTLAAMIQKINLERAAHIITIEDPVEFTFKDERASISQREIGMDSDSFASALRGALRQNPDVILVGELRDKETTETAMMAAETGHLVLSTLHTSDSVESLSRLQSYFPPHQQPSIRQMLARSLKAVLSQRLVPRQDGKGMAVAMEVLIINASVKHVLQAGENFEQLYQTIKNSADTYGMQTFDQSLLQLMQAGLISRDEAVAQATNRQNFELLLRGVGT